MGVSIGRYKERVEIYSRSMVTGPGGQRVPTYTLLYNLWAKYKSVGGGEGFEAKEKTGSSFADFEVRYQGITLDNTMRLKWITGDGMTYNITSISMEDFKSYYTLKCTAKDND